MLTLMSFLVLPASVLAFGWPDRLLQLILLFSVFEAAAALIIGSLGLQPGIVPASVFIGAVSLQYLLGVRYPGEREVLWTLTPFLLLTLVTLLGALALPRLFAGQVLVWPEKQTAGLAPFPIELGPTQGNITQSLYLIVNCLVLTATALFSTRSDLRPRALLDTYFVSVLVVLAVSLWQFASKLVGVWFPEDFFYSNPGWAILTEQDIAGVPRINGTFSEPAALATFLCGAAFASAWTVLHGHRGRLALCVLPGSVAGILLSTSTTGIATLLIGGVGLGLYALTGASATVRGRIVGTGAVGAALLGLLVALSPVIGPGLGDAADKVLDSTLHKDESASYGDRTALDLDSLATLGPTYGLGVGWGSNRSSSLIPGLLAANGVVGFGLLVWFVARILATLRGVRAQGPGTAMVVPALSAATLGVLVASLLSAPTIDDVHFYVLLGLLIGCAARLPSRAAPAPRRSGRVRPPTWTPDGRPA
jgi:hypothetical protein